jgi:hypothetical protein
VTFEIASGLRDLGKYKFEENGLVILASVAVIGKSAVVAGNCSLLQYSKPARLKKWD